MHLEFFRRISVHDINKEYAPKLFWKEETFQRLESASEMSYQKISLYSSRVQQRISDTLE